MVNMTELPIACPYYGLSSSVKWEVDMLFTLIAIIERYWMLLASFIA